MARCSRFPFRWQTFLQTKPATLRLTLPSMSSSRLGRIRWNRSHRSRQWDPAGLYDKAELLESLIDREEDGSVAGGSLLSLAVSLAEDVLRQHAGA